MTSDFSGSAPNVSQASLSLSKVSLGSASQILGMLGLGTAAERP